MHSKVILILMVEWLGGLLIRCALDCTGRVCCHRPVGIALAGLIPTFGSCLLLRLDNLSKFGLNNKVLKRSRA